MLVLVVKLLKRLNSSGGEIYKLNRGFYDEASSSVNLNKYICTDGTLNMSYDENKNCYSVSRTNASDYFDTLILDNYEFSSNCIIEWDIMITNYYYKVLGVGLYNPNNRSTNIVSYMMGMFAAMQNTNDSYPSINVRGYPSHRKDTYYSYMSPYPTITPELNVWYHLKLKEWGRTNLIKHHSY